MMDFIADLESALMKVGGLGSKLKSVGKKVNKGVNKAVEIAEKAKPHIEDAKNTYKTLKDLEKGVDKTNPEELKALADMAHEEGSRLALNASKAIKKKSSLSKVAMLGLAYRIY